MDTNSNKKIAAAFIERFSSGDIDHAHELLSEDLRWTITGNLEMSGVYTKKQFRAVNKGIVDTFVKSPTWLVDSMIAEGDQVAMVSHSMGDTPRGFQYRQKFHLLLTIKDDKIVEVIEYMDTKQVQDLVDHLAEGKVTI